MQPDTLIPDPSNPQAWNRYSYTFNNPIRYSDPTGHCPICLVAVLVVGALILSGDSPRPANEVSTSSVTVIDVLPDATMSSLSGSESFGLFSFVNSDGSLETETSGTMLAQLDEITNFNDPAAEEFVTSTHNANTECPQYTSCVDKTPYAHFMTPNAAFTKERTFLWGDSLKENIDSYAGKAYNVSLGIGPLTLSAFSSVNDSDGRANYKVTGITIGIGPSVAPVSISAYYTNTEKRLNKKLIDQ